MTYAVFADSGGWGNMWGSGTGMGSGWLWMTLIVLGTAWLIYGLVEGDEPEPGRRSKDAREILDQRYASGEIDREDYMRRRTDLEL